MQLWFRSLTGGATRYCWPARPSSVYFWSWRSCSEAHVHLIHLHRERAYPKISNRMSTRIADSIADAPRAATRLYDCQHHGLGFLAWLIAHVPSVVLTGAFAAVNTENMAGDKRGIVGGEVQDGPRYLIRRAEALHGN